MKKSAIMFLLLFAGFLNIQELDAITFLIASNKSLEKFLPRDDNGLYILKYNGKTEHYRLNYFSPSKICFVSPDEKKKIAITKNGNRLEIVKTKKRKTKILAVEFDDEWNNFDYRYCEYDGDEKTRELNGSGMVVERNGEGEKWYLGRIFLFLKISVRFSYSQNDGLSFLNSIDFKKQVF